MGNFSRDTFKEFNIDKLQHYVGVRLQQGVPLVDADWNEMEDIRKFELQAFLKWFVGNGVPKDNDGFHIMPTNPQSNDFIIRGGDGTWQGAGRCLVDGLDVMIENDIHYTKQKLYMDADLAQIWDVKLLVQLTIPPSVGILGSKLSRTDIVYLDVWEREVDKDENKDLKILNTDLESCVRLKREWVVRVAEDITKDKPFPTPPPGHYFYKLASLERKYGTESIVTNDVTDLRRTDVNLTDLLDEIVDARGIKGNLGNRLDESLTKGGQLRIPMIFRETGTASDKGGLWRLLLDKGVLHFDVNTGASGHEFGNNLLTPLAMNANGDVGIGTTETTYPLEVSRTGSTGAAIAIYSAGDVNNDLLFGSNGKKDRWTISSRDSKDGNGYPLTIWRNKEGWKEALSIDYSNGNVGIGTTEPKARLAVVAEGASEITGSAMSSTLITSAGCLGSSKENELALASFGFVSTNSSSLGIRAIRFLDGGDWRTTAIGLGMDVDNTVRAGASLWLNANGNVGIGTPDPEYKLDIEGNVRIRGSHTHLQGRSEVSGMISTHWIVGVGGGEALGFRETAGIHGPGTKDIIAGDGWNLCCTIKNFLIYHPLDPEHKYLIHSTLEGPEIAVFYRGEAQLSNGEEIVLLPEYFEALTRREDRTVLLTPRFEGDAPVSMVAASEVKDGKFTVKMIDRKNPSQKFYWEVKAIRADVGILEVERSKIPAK
jgi:hypothetical protein